MVRKMEHHFLCPKCRIKTVLPACNNCGYEIPQIKSIVHFCDGTSVKLEGEKQYIGYDNIGEDFEPEITYASFCNVEQEAGRIEKYISSGFFRSIDVCGGENLRPLEDFLPLYRKAELYHLIKKMHVGESGPAEDVRRAVEVLGLDEVHHGINAAASGEVMRFLADNRIQLNVCPSSNVMLGYAADYENHPIKVLYENGVKVTINTDDLLLFDSSIESEYLRLYQAGTLSAEQLDEIRINGLGEVK